MMPMFHATGERAGTVKWRIDTGEIPDGYITGGVYASPVVADGVVYVGALDGSLYALKR